MVGFFGEGFSRVLCVVGVCLDEVIVFFFQMQGTYD